MIRILHIIQHLSSGGAARSMIATAKYSSRYGSMSHSVASLDQPEPAAANMAQSEGMAVLPIKDRNELLMEMVRADVVHLHWWNNPQLMSLLTTPLPPMRLLIWFHVAGDHAPHVITDRIIDFADFTVPCNPHSYELPVFRHLPPETRQEKVAMIYDGADFQRFMDIRPKPHRTFNVGYIGTVDFIKMHPHYVPMSASINVPDIRFIVCGGGIQETLRRQARDLNAIERFDFRGYVWNIRPILEILDAYGYPLCEETYAAAELNLQEAMVCGIPPVVFPHGGIRKLVLNGETGIVVNSESEYREAIEHLYHNPDERRRLGNNAREYALRVFGAENAARQLNSVYERMMRQAKRTRSWSPGETPAGIVPDMPSTRPSNSSVKKIDGAHLFVQTLGEEARPFITSMKSQNIEELFEAERQIACSSVLLRSSVAGGIAHYNNYYPNDGFLRLWTGLVRSEEGHFIEAAYQFVAAMKLGCSHWRVPWYLAQAALNSSQLPLAEKAIHLVLKEVPTFAGARDLVVQIEKLKNLSHPTTELSQPPQRSKPSNEAIGQQLGSSPFRVSAIISTYNSEKFLWNRLEDLIQQTLYQQGLLEIIVINSGSQQNERATARSFMARYRNIKYIETQRETIYSAWNRGIKLAQGRYLTNANTDDRLRPDALEVMVDALETNGVGLVYCDALLTWGENETFSNNSADRVWNLPDYNLRQALMDCPFGCQVMWRKTLHESLGYFDPSFQVAGDYDFFLRASWQHGAYHIRKPLALYHESWSNLSYQNKPRIAEEVTRLLKRHRLSIPIEDIYPSVKDQPSAEVMSAVLVDFANHLISGIGRRGPREAEHFYRKAIALVGAAPTIINNLSLALYFQQRNPEATSLLESISEYSEMARVNLREIQLREPDHARLRLGGFHHPALDNLPPLVAEQNTRISLSEYYAQHGADSHC